MKHALSVLGLACSLTGCATSPDPIFYALSSRPGNALQSRPIRIEIRRTGLPSYLDRPHIVKRVTSERLALDADERWGAPLQEMVEATLADDLSERLPDCVVYTEAGSISAPADARVEVEVSRFELTDDGSVQLLAEVAVSWTATAVNPRIDRYTLSAHPRSSRTADVVSSMSLVLGQLSDAIAKAVLLGRSG